jgi:hypothetical protein
VWSSLLAKLPEEKFARLLANKSSLLKDYISLLDNPAFSYTISRDSLKAQSVRDRYERLSELINKYVI